MPEVRPEAIKDKLRKVTVPGRLGGVSTDPLQVDLAQYATNAAPRPGAAGNKQGTNRLSPEAARPAPQVPKESDLPKGLERPPEDTERDDPGGLHVEGQGPQGNFDPKYDGPIPVFQWQIKPEDPSFRTHKFKLSIDNWNYVVCWLTHPGEDLVYGSVQARHWISHGGKVRPNPAGRTEAVNLVYDCRRAGIVAIYGTVRDFRPFVEAFDRAFTGEAMGASDLRQADTQDA